MAIFKHGGGKVGFTLRIFSTGFCILVEGGIQCMFKEELVLALKFLYIMDVGLTLCGNPICAQSYYFWKLNFVLAK